MTLKYFHIISGDNGIDGTINHHHVISSEKKYAAKFVRDKSKVPVHTRILESFEVELAGVEIVEKKPA
jgi:hypothetical protein